MKETLVSMLITGWLMIDSVQANASSGGMKESVSLPPNVISFIAFKEQQAKTIASENGFALPEDFLKYFSAAKAGRAQEAKLIYAGFFKDTNDPVYKTSLKQAALDPELVLEAFASSDAALVQLLGADLMDSLPPGCIYFGGTDAGRGLPTLLCRSPGDPVFVLSQNAFTDGRYLQYIRDMYGSKIQLPTTNEMKEIIATASAGKMGFAAYAAGCGQVIKSIMAKNPAREFFYEQSFLIDDLSSNLSPHGLVLKLNPQPVNYISPKDIQDNDVFWSARIAQLKSNPAFAGDHYVRNSYAYDRATVASLYAHHAQTGTNMAERWRFCEAAERAFHEALDLNPALPGAVQQYAMFKTMVLGQPKEALAVVQKASQADPSNSQFKTLMVQLEQMVSASLMKTNLPSQTK